MHNRYAPVDRTADGDTLGGVTGTVIKHTARPAVGRGVRRLVTLTSATAALTVSGALLAGPASASVPVGWPETESVDMLEALGILVGIPLLLAALITAAVYLPGLARGERVAPGASGPEDQWLGGRRTTTAALTGPSDDASDSVDGGASARW
jgi:hypothetical protein